MRFQRHEEEQSWSRNGAYQCYGLVEKRRWEDKELPSGWGNRIVCESIWALWEGDTKVGWDIQEKYNGGGVRSRWRGFVGLTSMKGRGMEGLQMKCFRPQPCSKREQAWPMGTFWSNISIGGISCSERSSQFSVIHWEHSKEAWTVFPLCWM